MIALKDQIGEVIAMSPFVILRRNRSCPFSVGFTVSQPPNFIYNFVMDKQNSNITSSGQDMPRIWKTLETLGHMKRHNETKISLLVPGTKFGYVKKRDAAAEERERGGMIVGEKRCRGRVN